MPHAKPPRLPSAVRYKPVRDNGDGQPCGYPVRYRYSTDSYYIAPSDLSNTEALVVGSVDNVLRPRLVGQDARMHELLIFFSTLRGLMFFGAIAFILGPILAALFGTAWEMFGTTFRGQATAHSSSQDQ